MSDQSYMESMMPSSTMTARDFNQPVGIITKSAMVTRDLDILGPMAERGLAAVAMLRRRRRRA